MNRNTFVAPLRLTSVAFAIMFLAVGAVVEEATSAAETTVYHAEGKKRVHLKGCRRLTKDPDELATLTTMTLAEAEKKGLPPCSRCPKSATVGKGNPDGDKGDPKEKGSSNTTIYHPEGKKRVHLKGCRRLTKDPKELAKMTTMTLAEAEKKGLPLCSRCPGSSTLGKGNQGGGEKKSGPESWVKPAPETIGTAEFTTNPLSPLVSLGDGGRLTYKSYSDKGDRMLDFSTCGYMRSDEPIPYVEVVETLAAPNGEAVADGNMAYPKGPESHAMIQTALDKVAARPPNAKGFRGAVLLKKGTYTVTGMLRIRGGVVLRGEGDDEDGTVLIFRTKGGGVGIQLGNTEGTAESVGEPTRITDDYVPSGTNTFSVENATLFKVGDDVVITKTVNQKWIDVLGCGERLRHIRGGKEGAGKRPWKPEAYQFRNYRKVVKIDGNTITLDAMLPQSIAAEHGGGKVEKVAFKNVDSFCGVESLRVVSNYDPTVKDTGKSANFVNLGCGIHLKCMNSWVRNCSVLHTYGNAISIGSKSRVARYNTIRDCKCLKQIGPVRGGKRYPFNISGGSHALIYNCFVDFGRHSFAGGSRVQGPNAFVKCTALKDGQSEPHHRWGTGFLYDYITVKEGGTIAAINRGDSGSGHGWAAANTVVWNAHARSVVVFDPETEGENNFAIGHRGPKLDDYGPGGVKYANDRAGYWGTEREGKYYGYALMGNGYIESPDKPVEPASLFVQQLIDRIGKDKADAVLK